VTHSAENDAPSPVTLTNGELAEYGQPNEHEPTELLFDRRDVEAIVAARIDALTADLAAAHNRAERAEVERAERGLVIANVRALADEPCYVTRHVFSRCLAYVNGAFSNGGTWTIEMCCFPCRLRALLPGGDKP
jgi:hypothetical protein